MNIVTISYVIFSHYNIKKLQYNIEHFLFISDIVTLRNRTNISLLRYRNYPSPRRNHLLRRRSKTIRYFRPPPEKNILNQVKVDGKQLSFLLESLLEHLLQ